MLPDWNDVASLKSLSQLLAIGACIFGVFVAVATGFRFFVDRRVSELSSQSLQLRENAAKARIDAAEQAQVVAEKRLHEIEQKQRPRTITTEQYSTFIDATKAGPFGPVVLATRTAFPTKEQEDFTMALRKMLDEAGFGNKAFDIVNGFSTGVDPKQFLSFVSDGDTPPPYFSNLAGGLYKIGLVSLDVPVAVKNPNAKPGVLYVFIPEK